MTLPVALVLALVLGLGLAVGALFATLLARRAPRGDDVAALAAVANAFSARAALYGPEDHDRRRYAEMWFDVHRLGLLFLMAERGPDPLGTKRRALGLFAREFVEWYDRKFFEYVEVIKGKFSRKGFMYPMVLDDFQRLWCDLFALIEASERSGLPEARTEGLLESRRLADEVVQRAGSGAGVVADDVDWVVREIKRHLHLYLEFFPVVDAIPTAPVVAPRAAGPPPLPFPDWDAPTVADEAPPRAWSEVPPEVFEASADPFQAMLDLQRRQREAAPPSSNGKEGGEDGTS